MARGSELLANVLFWPTCIVRHLSTDPTDDGDHDLCTMFTLRVYGILTHNGNVLVSDEIIKGRPITKFPGGGLEFGEGFKDCLIREIQEEIGVVAFDLDHFYTTDFFQQSTFHEKPMQVISVYYRFSVEAPGSIPVVDIPFGGDPTMKNEELFRWLPIASADNEDVTLPIDRVVMGMLKQSLKPPTFGKPAPPH